MLRQIYSGNNGCGTEWFNFNLSLAGSSITCTEQNTSRREADPLNDFRGDDKGLATSFPHVFMLGKGYGRAPGQLNRDNRHHLLKQFTLVPAQDRRLMGFLFDVLQRTRVMKGVNAYVDDNKHAMETIQNLLQHPEERVKLLQAIKTPECQSSKQILNKYLTVLKFAGKDIPYGVVEGTKLKHRAMGMVARYSASTCFLTISAENLSNPRSLRLSCRTINNNSFPAKFSNGSPLGATGEEFIRHIAEASTVISEGEIELPPFSLPERAKLASDNPIAFVTENKSILDDILSILIGATADIPEFYSKTEGTSVRRTRYFKNVKGILGFALAFIGVTEDHAKGHLHWHLTVNAGLTAYALQRFANLKELCEKISKVLSTIYATELVPAAAAATILRNTVLTNHAFDDMPRTVKKSMKPLEPLLQRPTPLDILQQRNANEEYSLHRAVMESIQIQCADKQFHRHQNTCHKGTWGCSGCRLNMPAATLESTSACLLSMNGDEDNEDEVDDADNNIATPMDSQTNPSEHAYIPTVTNTNKRQKLSPGEMIFPQPVQVSQYGENMDTFSTDQATEQQQEESALFSHSVLMGQSPQTDMDRKHYLQPVLELEDKDSVVIWETARPINSLPQFLQDPVSFPYDRPHFITNLKNFLNEATSLSSISQSFWKWIETQATDDQILCIRQELILHLPSANGYVAAFNPIISFCSGSHNNASLLGSLEQAKSAMFYLIPYQGKTKFDFHQSLTILDKALHHTKICPSTSSDTGTLRRTTKHILQRTLNRMHLQMEISDYQIAAALLELPSLILSDRFSYGNPGSLTAFRTFLSEKKFYTRRH